MHVTKTLSLRVVLPPAVEECDRCVERLRDTLLQMSGVSSADLDRETSTLLLGYDPHSASIEEVERRARRIGIELEQNLRHETLTLVGLDCLDCALKVEKGVGRMRGVLWASTNYTAGKISVEYEPTEVDISAIRKRIRELGVDLDSTDAADDRTEAHRRGFFQIDGRTALTAIAGVAILAGLLTYFSGWEAPSQALYAVAGLAAGAYTVRGAYYSLRSLVLDMNVLMTIAAAGAMVIGEWFEAAAVMFLFALGNTLEARSIERTRRSIRSLADLFPPRATVIRGGKEESVEIARLQVGDLMVVRPGEKIATDGIVTSGVSSVNQAAVTGESVPVEKSVGDAVMAGSLNQQGALEVRATATSSDNTLARIIHLVEEAQAEKAPTQRFAEIFGRYYTPAVIILAGVVAGVWPLIAGVTRVEAVYISLTLLVVACPCALVISTPVAIISAIGNAARNGVLIKGGAHLETAGRLAAIAFDKTGTLTTGKSSVTRIIPSAGSTEEEVIRAAASVESRSEHPIATAIVAEARRRDITSNEITAFEALPGMGASGVLDSARAAVGNARLMSNLGIDCGAEAETVARLEEEGNTAVLVAARGRIVGVVGIADTVRESAPDMFAQLRKSGIARLLVLSGDNESAARRAALRLGADEYYGGLLPQDKVDIVRRLIRQYGRVAVVGDGVNDAPALAVSSLGIAMGAAGSDVALEAADVALMSDDLRRLPYAIRLSRRTLSVIRQNIAFSLLVIVALIGTTLAGNLRLSFGVFAHEGSALLVIANGMRLLRYK